MKGGSGNNSTIGGGNRENADLNAVTNINMVSPPKGLFALKNMGGQYANKTYNKAEEVCDLQLIIKSN